MRSKGLLILLAALCIAALCSGCSMEEPAIEGCVYWLEGSQFLVVAGIESVDIPYDEWFQAGDHPAIVFTVVPQTRIRLGDRYGGMSDIAVGSWVKVWARNGVALSYPGQATAARVEIRVP